MSIYQLQLRKSGIKWIENIFGTHIYTEDIHQIKEKRYISNIIKIKTIHIIMGNKTEYNKRAPFTFDHVEKLLRTKNFGILSTITPTGKPHSVGVVYAISPPPQSFSIYLLSRMTLKKVKNISNNPHVAFVVPFPHHIIRMIPPACIQFSGKAELISFDDAIARRAFQSSIVLRRSIIHNLSIGGENTFIRITPNDKIFSFGIDTSIWQILIRPRNKNLKNYYVNIPNYHDNQDSQK